MQFRQLNGTVLSTADAGGRHQKSTRQYQSSNVRDRLRVRLGAALAITVLMLPLMSGFAPLAPSTPADLMLLLAAEATVGLVIGLAFRFLVFALQIAGMVAAQHLSIAQMFGAGVAPVRSWIMCTQL